ncbi:MAG: LLM class flavin-dependent oxidoreductase [SAR202 cluster bacterium]|nr:LLM class flavin-dependent oxidoreductase [SAR202 cluster bacterium]
MALPERMRFGIFMAPFQALGENPTLSLDRSLELLQWLDYLGYDEAWVGEHHSAGWEIIASPEVFIATAAERTKHIKLGTGVVSLPYHHPLMTANRMVLLDHLTRGRAMFGVGPGALVSDAVMMGINPPTQRPRMEESLDVIMKLFTSTKPITHESDWFTLKEARLHLRPYTKPHMPIAVAAVQSPSGMMLAGKHGASILTISVPAVGTGTGNNSGMPARKSLKEYWKIAEESAAKHGKTVKREEWRLVAHAFLAETKKEAMDRARRTAGVYQREYFEETLGNAIDYKGPIDGIIDFLVGTGQWCVGTPDDLVEYIHRLDEESGGFGGFLVQGAELGTREELMHSYELIARYVMPKFQGSLENLVGSRNWTAERKDQFQALRRSALTKAQEDFAKKR